jgi:hypothetical protein
MMASSGWDLWPLMALPMRGEGADSTEHANGFHMNNLYVSNVTPKKKVLRYLKFLCMRQGERIPLVLKAYALSVSFPLSL